jgi:hypothetical protein
MRLRTEVYQFSRLCQLSQFERPSKLTKLTQLTKLPKPVLALLFLAVSAHAAGCDVNSDSSTNVADVQLCVNQAISVLACSTGDIDANGQCNVVDVQRVVNAALGGLCVGGAGAAWPDATNTGVPAGTVLHSCPTTITASGTYDACLFAGDVSIRASNVTIKNSQINGSVDAQSGLAGQQSGLVIMDSTINCNCMSVGPTDTPTAIQESNYTLLRVNLYNSGHGAAVKNNVTIQDSYIHGLGGNTDAHKDGIFVGDGTNVVIRHNSIECNDGPVAGCTSAIGLLSDFGVISNFTIDHNLLNTNGSYCFYGGGGPQKPYAPNHITFTNNHFGRKDNLQCGFFGPVTYFDINAPGNVWSGNVWDDTGAAVPAAY